MEQARQAEALARLVDLLATSGKLPSVNEPADLAAATARLPAGAVDWAVMMGRQCADAVVAAMGEGARWLPEDETRRAIEMEVLSLLRHVAGNAREFQLNPDQISIAHKMARHGLPYERYMGGLRLVQTIVLSALLDQAADYRPAQARSWLPGALAATVTRFFDQSVGAVVSE